MSTWISQVLSNEHASIMILIAVLVMGMLSVFTCACNFTIIGVVAGYTGATSATGKTRLLIWKGFAFLAGTIISMALIGALFGYAGEMISDSLGDYWKIAAGLTAVVFGLYTMDLFPVRLPGIAMKPGRDEKNFFSAILFGLAVGGLSSAVNSCCNPLFPVILAASFMKGSAMWGLVMLTFFALGFGLPLAAMMVGLGLGIGRASGALKIVGTVVKYAGGTALVILGFYFLLTF